MIPLLFGGVLYMIQKDYEAQFIDYVRGDAYQLSNDLSQISSAAKIAGKLDDALLSGRIAYADYSYPDGQSTLEIDTTISKEDFREDFYFGQNNDAIYFIKVRINRTNGTTHELRLGYDENATQSIISTTYRRGVYIAVSYIAITFVIMVLIGRQLTRPLNRLEQLSSEIAHGHYEGTLKVGSSIREVRHLADTLDFMRDQLVKKTNAMEHQALHDALTELPNRALLRDRVGQAFLAGRRDKNEFSLMLLDLDHFKEINDTLGHNSGDMILERVANKLLSCVRRSDTVARVGGDEFAVLLPASNEVVAVKIATKIFETLKEPFRIGESIVHVGASIGIAVFPKHDGDFESLLRRADAAMYAAKADHMGVVVYHAGLDKDNVNHLTMAAELRAALERKELILFFQPKMHLNSNALSGAEALSRWNHPARGFIPPDEFIPLAERTGLIHPLTQWVLTEAIGQCGKWHKDGYALPMAINLSAHNLRDGKLPDTIAGLLDKNELPASLLTIEITESAIFTDPFQAQAILKRIEDMGVQLAIDDFGTGYSSLYQLRNLPVSQLKIDRSFIADMIDNESDAVMVKAIINMAHDLNLTTVAEGVEDLQTINSLKVLGCDYAQGFYFSPPLPLEKFEHEIMHYEHPGIGHVAGGPI